MSSRGVKSGDEREETLLQKLIMSHKGGVTKHFKTPSIFNNGKESKTNMSGPTKTSSLLSTLASH